jgi:hypothetical protein
MGQLPTGTITLLFSDIEAPELTQQKAVALLVASARGAGQSDAGP